MHYSDKQKQEIKELRAAVWRAEQVIQDFRAHLASSKFFNDTTIQVKDVEGWLNCVKAALGDF